MKMLLWYINFFFSFSFFRLSFLQGCDVSHWIHFWHCSSLYNLLRRRYSAARSQCWHCHSCRNHLWTYNHACTICWALPNWLSPRHWTFHRCSGHCWSILQHHKQMDPYWSSHWGRDSVCLANFEIPESWNNSGNKYIWCCPHGYLPGLLHRKVSDY